MAKPKVNTYQYAIVTHQTRSGTKKMEKIIKQKKMQNEKKIWFLPCGAATTEPNLDLKNGKKEKDNQ